MFVELVFLNSEDVSINYYVCTSVRPQTVSIIFSKLLSNDQESKIDHVFIKKVLAHFLRVYFLA